MDAIEYLSDVLTVHGVRQYGAEAVSQLEHALQCAALADEEGAPPALVVAALLHDVGHMLHGLDPNRGRRGEDDRHETTGAALIGRWFGPEVTEPIRLHVPAKRYLCAVDPCYYDGLSRASRASLRMQGDAFDADEADRFICQPYAEAAVILRRWDDRAKTPGRAVPRVVHYRRHLERLMRCDAATAAVAQP